MTSSKGSQPVPYPLDLRQKLGSLKQRPCRLLSPISRSPMGGLAQKCEGLLFFSVPALCVFSHPNKHLLPSPVDPV